MVPEDAPDEVTPDPSALWSHTSHIFTGWASFLEHLRDVHHMEPLEDDGESWLVHDAMHRGSPGSPPPPPPE